MQLRKAATIILAAVISTVASAQNRQITSWQETSDSLAVLLKERGGVAVELKIKSALRKGKNVDIYFTDNLKFYPWRSSDIDWFRGKLTEFLPQAYAKYSVGKVYAKAQLLEQLVQPEPGNNGKPVTDELRVKDRRNDVRPLVTRVDGPQFSKGLDGRHIALWQSHGYYYNDNQERWIWQRAPLFTTVEDVYTLTYVVPFLTPMLENAGANVMLPRDRDFSAVEVVTEPVANSWTVDIPEKGNYAVYVFYKSTSSSSDKAQYTIRHAGGETSFLVNQKIGGGAPVYLGSFDFNEGVTTFTLSNKGKSNTTVNAGKIKVGGGIGVSGQPRYVEGATYWLQYTGADSTIWNQNKGENDYRDDFMCRGAWVNWLSAGSALHPGKYIPPKDGNDKQPASRDGLAIPVDLCLAFHTDAGIAPGDTTIGTLSIYTRVCEGKHDFPDGESRMQNRQLADIVQSQIVGDIRANWNPDWIRREIWDKSYSESRTPMVPSMLLELLSHQNFGDMKYGLDPAFRFDVCRAVYKGILKFLSNRYGCNYVVQPLPVHAFSAVLDGSSSVSLSWEPTEDPLEPTATSDRYIIYTRMDDGGFDNGTIVEGCSTQVEIEAGHVYSWKVEAMNEGGKSFPSEILSAGVPENGNTGHSVLVVNNFTRISGPAVVNGDSYAGFNTAVDGGVPYISNPGYIGEMYEWRRDRRWKSDDNAGFGASFTDGAGSPVAGNTFDFVSIHGKAILAAGHAFSSVSREVFCGMPAEDIWSVDLICGKQLTCNTGSGEAKYSVFPQEIQDQITLMTGNGTNFLISGANIGSDISDDVWGLGKDREFTESSEQFAAKTLGYELMTSRSTRTGNVQFFKSRKFSDISLNLSVFHFNNTISPDRYCVEAADALSPANSDGHTFLRYADSGTSAGICYNPGNYKTICLGFPIEIVTDEDAIDELILSSLKYFEK